jgi:hypothetical protein
MNTSKSTFARSGRGLLYLMMRWVSKTLIIDKYSATSTLGFFME